MSRIHRKTDNYSHSNMVKKKAKIKSSGISELLSTKICLKISKISTTELAFSNISNLFYTNSCSVRSLSLPYIYPVGVALGKSKPNVNGLTHSRQDVFSPTHANAGKITNAQ